MALLHKRRQFGTIDRMLVAVDPKVDGFVEEDGPLKSKWADMAHLHSTESCVIESAMPTEFCFKAKCCRIAFTVIFCQITAAEGQKVEYTVCGSNDDFETEVELSKTVVIGASEVVVPMDNSQMVDGVEEYFKQIRIKVALNGDPIETYVYLMRGIC